MERKDAAYWKERYEVQENLIVNAMTDLENYRSLVHRLKKEIDSWRIRCEWSETRSKNMEKNMKKVLIEEIQFGYRDTYQN